LDLILQIIKFFIKRKKFWLVPIVLASLMFGGLLFISQGTAVAPFIYTLF